ncbi:MAG: carbohydrate-binding family 9-like protein [Lentisphaeria bacterium]|nr:carbohydrate-binding family 9-like protein [Lentisphaeria bacterium]
MKKLCLFAVLLGTIILFAAPPTFRPKVQVKKVKNFNIETGIDHPAWKEVKGNDFRVLVYSNHDMYRRPTEPATVKYLYDDKYFYVLADMVDSDVMTTGTKSGSHFYLEGDLLEVFIKPANANYYWEIYGTPNKLDTRFYFGSRSAVGLPSGFTHKDVGIKVAVKVNGTFNNPSDRDKSCKTLVAIPLTELNRPHLTKENPAGTAPFAPGETWLVLAARYNYSCHMDTLELSSFPQIYGGYHNLEYFAEIELLK